MPISIDTPTPDFSGFHLPPIPRGEPAPATTPSLEEVRECVRDGILDAVRALAGGISLRPDEIAALARYNAQQADFRRAAQRKVFEAVNDANL